MITKETRAESLRETDKAKRYNEIKEALKGKPSGLTARELSENLGYIERNATAPRCTELVKMGDLEVIGKRYDTATNRNVAVYALKKKVVDMGQKMKCENCDLGYLKWENGKLKEVYCGKFNGNIPIPQYKKLRVCQFFKEDKRKIF